MNEIPKYIFLDLDGVMNKFYGKWRWPDGKIGVAQDLGLNLKHVVEETGADIVMSTSWRIYPDVMTKVGKQFDDLGIPRWIGSTPNLRYGCPTMRGRANEIRQWIFQNVDWHNDYQYAVLDDRKQADTEDGCFFRTDPERGLTMRLAKHVIEHLNSVELEPAS